MFISYEDIESHYSIKPLLISPEDSHVGKDFNTLNPELDPVKLFFRNSTSDPYEQVPMSFIFEKGIWNIDPEGSGTPTTVYVLQLQSPETESGFPITIDNFFMDENYSSFVKVTGTGGLRTEYDSSKTTPETPVAL